MKKRHLIFLFVIFLAFQSCKTVSNKVDKTISEEEKKLSKFLNKTTEELKIEFGEPDLIEITDKQNKNFVYLKSKLKIKWLFFIIQLFIEYTKNYKQKYNFEYI